MITARIANEISEVPILGEEPLLRGVQNNIIEAALEGVKITIFLGYMPQRTIDFIQDLGYNIVEVEEKNEYCYIISWV